MLSIVRHKILALPWRIQAHKKIAYNSCIGAALVHPFFDCLPLGYYLWAFYAFLARRIPVLTPSAYPSL